MVELVGLKVPSAFELNEVAGTLLGDLTFALDLLASIKFLGDLGDPPFIIEAGILPL